MEPNVKVPIKIVRGEKWGDLSALGLTHEICGETVHQDRDLSFQGGHRVRLYKFKKNVHWRIPVNLDIEDVPVSEVPKRKPKVR